jgi:hypothetical protein
MILDLKVSFEDETGRTYEYKFGNRIAVIVGKQRNLAHLLHSHSQIITFKKEVQFVMQQIVDSLDKVKDTQN